MTTSIRRMQALAFALVLLAGAEIGLGARYDVLIHVHVTDASTRSAIPNAGILWATYEVPMIPGSWGEGVTDAAGTYSFEPIYGSGHGYGIDVYARNYAWGRLQPAPPPPGEQHYTIALTPVDGTPIVDAGPDRIFSVDTLPIEYLYFETKVTDPDAYWNGVLSGSKESGPGNVSFYITEWGGIWETRVKVDAFGVYNLRLTYTDQYEDAGWDTVTVTVQSGAPVVDAGPDLYVSCDTPPCETSLQGAAHDPDNFPSALTSQWRVVAGPGGVLFANDAEPATSASFSAPGVYILELVASDGKVEVSDQVEITVGIGTGGDGSCAPISHWKLDEGSGTVARDSRAGHDGTLVGPVEWAQGPPGFGGTAAFNPGGRIEVADEAAFDLTDTITVAAWIITGRIDVNWAGIVAKGDSAWRLSTYLNQPRLHFAVTGAAAAVNGSVAVGLNEWHHVAGTFDGAQIRLYVDGLEDPAGPVAYAGPIGTNDLPVWIGNNAEWPGRGFIGGIDDVRIYNCALSPDRIAALMSDFSDKPASLRIREVIDNGLIRDQNDCYRSLGSGLGTVVEYNAPVLNISDVGEMGHFGNDDPFGVVREGRRAQSLVDDLALRAEGVLRIPAGRGGTWTFGVNSDDGFTLQFPGRNFLSAVNGEIVNLSGSAALRFFGIRAASDTFGTISLPAGDHPFWLTYHEGYGGAAVELFGAEGTHTTFDPEVFRLVGRLDIGAVATPGLCADVTMEASQPGAWSGGLIDSLADATAALAQSRAQRTNLSQHYGSVNHKDPDVGGPNSGIFANDTAFPNDAPGRDEDDFAVQVTGQLDIPVGGLYQIGFNSDDGALLRIPGQSWRSVVTDSTGQAVMAGDELRNDALTGWSFTAGEIELPAGCHGFEVVLFERAGGAFIELFGRGVSTRGIADPMWHLLRAGGSRPPAPIEGLQLVDPAATLDSTLPGPGGR